VACLIPCPPVMLPGMFQSATLKPWMLQSSFQGQAGHRFPEELSPSLACVTRSPVPNISTERWQRAGGACCQMNGMGCCRAPCLHAPRHAASCWEKGRGLFTWQLGSSGGQDEPRTQICMPCVYFSTQFWPNVGLKLLSSSLLPQLETAVTD